MKEEPRRARRTRYAKARRMMCGAHEERSMPPLSALFAFRHHPAWTKRAWILRVRLLTRMQRRGSSFLRKHSRETRKKVLRQRSCFDGTTSSVRSACTRPEGSLMRYVCHEALLQASCGNNRPGHLERACHGNTPALLPMKTRLPKRIVPRDQSPSLRSSAAAAAAYLICDFRGVAWGLLLGTSFASTKRIVRGIVKGGPALRASMFITPVRLVHSDLGQIVLVGFRFRRGFGSGWF